MKPIVGTYVSFTSKRTGDIFKGSIYFFRPDTANFGIDSVWRTNAFGRPKLVEGYYQFSLNDIKDLRVIPALPSSTTNDTATEDQKNNPGGASSSSTLPSICVSDEAITKIEHVQRRSILFNLQACFGNGVACILENLLRSESNADALLAFQLAFHFLDKGQNQSFHSGVIDRLPAPKSETRRAEIGQLPPENIIDILARLPKRLYPIVSAVCMDWQQLLHSHEILRIRGQLYKDAIYLCFDSSTSRSSRTKAWFTLRKKEDNPSEDVFAEEVVLPNAHEWVRSSGKIFAVGTEIVLVSGEVTKVWLYDTRTSILRQAPSMPVVLHLRNAGIVGHNLYVFGTKSTAQTIAERLEVHALTFNLQTETWASTAPFAKRMNRSDTTESVDGNLYLIKRHVISQQYYNPREGTLIPYDLPYRDNWSATGLCVKDNVLYFYDSVYGLYWYDTVMTLWKEVIGSTLMYIREYPVQTIIGFRAMRVYYGRLALIWSNIGGFCQPDANVWCTMIHVERIGNEIRGEVEAFKPLGTIPSRYELVGCVAVSD